MRGYVPTLRMMAAWHDPPCPSSCPSRPQGGRAGIGKGASVLRDVEIFDPATNTWCSAAPMVSRCASCLPPVAGTHRALPHHLCCSAPC